MRRSGELVLACALMAVVGWPVLATVWDTFRAEEEVDLAVPTNGPALPIKVAQSASNSSPIQRTLRRQINLGRETLKLVGLTEAIALPAGLVLAWLLFRSDVFGRKVLLALMALSVFVPMPLHAVGWLGSFGNAGRMQAFGDAPILVGLAGAAFVHAMAAVPWVVFLAGVGMLTVEPELEDAARVDLPAWLVVWKITLRRSIGAILGAALAIAVLTAGDMTVTDVLQVRTYAEEAYLQAQLGLGQGDAAAKVALPMLLVLGPVLIWSAVSLLNADPSRLPSAHARARTWPLGPWRIPVGLATLAVVGNVIALPVYGLIWRAGRVSPPGSAPSMSPHWSFAAMTGSLARAWPDLMEARSLGPWLETLDSRPLVGTMLYAAIGAALAVAIAWPMAWLSRDKSLWRWVVGVCAALSLSAPGPLVGMAIKRAYLMVPIIHDTPALLVIGYIAKTLPFAVLVLWPSVRGIPAEFLDSARLDGLGPWRLFWRIGLPMTRGAIVAAWGVAFVLAMGELPTAYFLSNPGYDPVARIVWGLLHTGVESRLAAIGLILISFSAVAGFAAAKAVELGIRT